jgi:hypothetical protein
VLRRLIVRQGSGRPAVERDVQQAEQLLDLDRKLPAVLQDKAKPVNAIEQLNFAWLCAQPYKQRYASSARLYPKTFIAEPKWADAAMLDAKE